MLINVMDQSGINIALPRIAEEFSADIPTVQWISLGYTLATSAMLMPMGRLSDMIGRKRVYLCGFALFVVLAAVGGMSQTLGVLIAVKIAQGLASAGVQANSMAFITEVFPDNQRGKAMGMYMAIIGSGAISGTDGGRCSRHGVRLEVHLLRRHSSFHTGNDSRRTRADGKDRDPADR